MIEYNNRNREVMEMYRQGHGCVRIAMTTGMSIATVHSMVKDSMGQDINPRM